VTEGVIMRSWPSRTARVAMTAAVRLLLGSPVPSAFKNAASFCRAQRAFLGESAFRQRYGTNGNGANAFGKCVSQSH
jgi:hypothetical protein